MPAFHAVAQHRGCARGDAAHGAVIDGLACQLMRTAEDRIGRRSRPSRTARFAVASFFSARPSLSERVSGFSE